MKTEITPELAQLWIDEATLAQDLGAMRPIRDWHVSFLAREMLKGKFSQSAIIGIGRLQGREGILNGNHTLRAIVRSGVTITLPVEMYDCRSEKEFRHLYATWDTGQKRKRVDSLRAYDAIQMFGHGEQVAQSDVQNLSSAVMFMLKGFGDTFGTKQDARPSDLELMEEMKLWVEPYSILRAITGGGNTNTWNGRILRRQGVCSVALITLRDQPDLARNFWQMVVSGVIPMKHSPALRLRDYLLKTRSVGGGARKKESEPAFRMARITGYCWSRFYEGKAIQSMRVNMEQPPQLVGCMGVRRPDAPRSATLRGGNTMLSAA